MVICLFGQTYHADADMEELERIGDELLGALATVPGFVSYHVYHGDDGEDLGVVRFESREALEAWRDHPDHRATWERATEFFPWFWIQNCDTYREYLWEDGKRTATDLAGFFSSRSLARSGWQSPTETAT